MNKKLYVIGNGFDLHHKLKTSYYSFATYLKDQNPKLYDILDTYVSYPSSDTDLWYQFESNLANLNAEEILSENIGSLPDYFSNTFKPGDRFAFPDIMEEYLRLLTTGLIELFTEFIQQVEYPRSTKDYVVELDIEATFLSFNYTKTLEKLYGIDTERIRYIHNSAYFGSGHIILGHGITPKAFLEEGPEPPDDVDPEDYEEWYRNNTNWDYSYDTGKETLFHYFLLTYKPTEKVIQNNRSFFDSLKNVESVFVLGHSIAAVDLPYFEELVKSLKETVIWNVSFFNYSEKVRHLETLKDLGIPEERIIQFELTAIQKSNVQLKLSFK